MTEKRYIVIEPNFEDEFIKDTETGEQYNMYGACELLNKKDKEIKYWKENAMTLLLQVRRLLPRMTDKEIAEYSKELEKIQDERQIQ